MKYNALFIRAVHLVQQSDGEQAAETLFNALFVQKVAAASVPELTPAQLHVALNRELGFYVYLSDIQHVNDEIGIPREGWNHAVPWIKKFREVAGCGLKDAKDVHHFVRDNPLVVAA